MARICRPQLTERARRVAGSGLTDASRPGSWVLVATGLGLLVAACGAGSQTGGQTAGQTVGPTRLLIEVWLRPEAGPAQYTLACDPPGGTVPDPPGACARLLEADQLFEPLPPGTSCTQIYGGPERAVVRGELRGAPVHAAFSRQNGCEIHRYDRLMELLGVLRG